MVLEQLKDICKFKHVELTARDINKKMETNNLNDIEAEGMAKLIKSIKKADVMIDVPDRYSWIFKKRMSNFKVERFEAEHKADENYPIVAAASIMAKVLRELNVEKIKKKTGVDFGSGYPSDPKTRGALRIKTDFAKLSNFIRKKWKTLETVKQRKLFE